MRSHSRVSKLTRLAGLAVFALGAVTLDAVPAHATGAILAPTTETGLTAIDVQLAVAVAPERTTRWTRITTTGSRQVMWLVPVRPGARLDWSPSAWLDALEEVTAPRVATVSSARCPVPWVERAPSWGATGPTSAPSAVFVHDTESAVRAHAAARGYIVTGALSSRIAEVYARGEFLASVELLGAGARLSSPTLRVSDDAPPSLPFALTSGATTADARLTVFAFGAGPMAVGVTQDVEPAALTWSSTTSNYRTLREEFLTTWNGERWFRESASHDVLFAGTALPDSTNVLSLAETYFRAVSSSPGACEASAGGASLMRGALGHVCPPGALARAPGGDDCTPDRGTISPITMTCDGADDLALALSDLEPSSTVVTRLAGIIPWDTLGTNAPLSRSGRLNGPLYDAVSSACAHEPAATSDPPPEFTAPPPSSSPDPAGSYVVASDGCGGGTVTTTSDEGDDSESTASSDDSCGSRDSTGSNDGSGWDSSDDSSSSDDSCSSSSDKTGSSDDSGWDDDDSSDSSDSCSGSGGGCSSTSTGGDDDEGWDENSAAPKTRSTKIRPTKKKSSLGPRRKRGTSPVSRLALFVVAVVLPLRRRVRKISF